LLALLEAHPILHISRIRVKNTQNGRKEKESTTIGRAEEKRKN